MESVKEVPQAPTGNIAVLHAREGDLKISYNKTDSEEEKDRARTMIEAMLAKGYTLVVKSGDKYRRVKKFNPEHNTYFVRDIGADADEEIPAEGADVVATPKSAGGCDYQWQPQQ